MGTAAPLRPEVPHKEIELVAAALPHRRTVAQLHWGGGTPTSLSEEQIVHFLLDVAEAERRFGISLRSYVAEEQAPLAQLVAAGFVTDDGSRIEVTPAGRIFVRNVAMTFNTYLRRPRQNQDDRPLFSRTV